MPEVDEGLNEDFRDMLQALNDAGVEYVVVGAHALALHGMPRATGDLDVLVRPSGPNAAGVLRALEAFGAPVGAHGVMVDDLQSQGTVYQIGLPPRRIDILTSLTGVSFDEAWAGHVTLQVTGIEVPFLGREELIRNKRATGREKDLVDVKALTGEV